jgi:exonuclease VII small subunit
MWKEENDMSTQPAPTLASYTEAMNQFTKYATAFMDHVHLLTEARDAYEDAMTTSRALRNSLDASDQTLRSLMIQMEQVINAHLGEVAPERRPELLRVEATRTNGQSAGNAVRALP